MERTLSWLINIATIFCLNTWSSSMHVMYKSIDFPAEAVTGGVLRELLLFLFPVLRCLVL